MKRLTDEIEKHKKHTKLTVQDTKNSLSKSMHKFDNIRDVNEEQGKFKVF